MTQYEEELLKNSELFHQLDEMDKKNSLLLNTLEEYQNIIKDLKEKNKLLENSNVNNYSV